ncbi:hypothetical protein LJC44_03930 [Parabacteroides sp. OttesenSCG-928-G06]|nr:hypothetical protein [Parabacteroides sp. OttesenSCG-928-G06]
MAPPFDSDRDPATHTWRIDPALGGDGYFYDMAPHTLDILDFFFGEITEAKGFGVNLGGLYAVSDTVTATLRFASGVLGSGRWCFVGSESSVCDKIVIAGTKGEIHLATFSFAPIRLITDDGEETFVYERPEHIQQPLIQTIVDELRSVGVCPSTGISGARTSRVMDCILK